ncbi:hypothetical protein ACWT_0517 [Actinoplanes sp. SE50]|uniref:DUF397 domain-containing protein n=1 Tax=unclassified Actinoplanes TaxID=2626549 RepID=UPI00023ECBF1|nr:MULTISPECIES: DUF397 domain-containing protein [unclassified Actinoplanes]AEV81530.1 hypothetical protein ACPL_633 [Actinoplanes sp. SE50/110]ATO79932.1 hypothetical protein ACWT_0517 [Actinoplanes sp. SE50]SLL97334.1 hypothetical protein ACSP50_0535 [Actinoplanes sp. SE50/110]
MSAKGYAAAFDPATAVWLRSGNDEDGYVEIARLPDGGAAMRNSRDTGTTLFFTKGEWDAFTGGVFDGEFDI